MFRLTYLITSPDIVDPKCTEDEYNNEVSIAGMIELDFNGKTYGYVYEGAQPSFGNYWLDNWFEHLLIAVDYLERTGYALIYDYETPDRWIEIKRIPSERVIISLLIKHELNLDSFVFSTPLTEPRYGDWYNEEIDYEQFRTEVIEKSKQFVQEVRRRNPLYESNKQLNEIEVLIREREGGMKKQCL